MIARLLVIACVLTVAVLSTPAGVAAQGDPREQAREAFSRGVARYADGDYRAALDAFLEAYRLRPHPAVRVNVANCFEHLGQPAQALTHFERYLEEVPDARPEQVREIRSAIERLSQRVGMVTLEVSPPQAMVRLNGSEPRQAPTRSFRLRAGSHALEVSHAGYRTLHREFIVEGGQPANVRIELIPENAAVVDPGTGQPSGALSSSGQSSSGSAGASGAQGSAGSTFEDTEGEGGGGLSTRVVITGSITAALVLGAVVTGLGAISADGDFDDAVRRSNDPTLSREVREAARLDGLDAAGSASDYALVTDIFLVGALVGAGLTTYFLLTEDEESSSVSARPVASPSSGGLLLEGRF